MDRLLDDWSRDWVAYYSERYPVTDVHREDGSTYLLVRGNIGVELRDPTLVAVTYPSEVEGYSLFQGSPQSAADFVEWADGYVNG